MLIDALAHVAAAGGDDAEGGDAEADAGAEHGLSADAAQAAIDEEAAVLDAIYGESFRRYGRDAGGRGVHGL